MCRWRKSRPLLRRIMWHSRCLAMLRSRLRVAELAHNIVYAVAHDALAGEFAVCKGSSGCSL